MGTSQPIRDREQVFKMRDFYRSIEPNPRNYTLVVMGLNTALRISDLLNLKWGDVYDNEHNRVNEYLYITERKTGKRQIVCLNDSSRQALQFYHDSIKHSDRYPDKSTYLFFGKTYHISMSRSQAYRIIRHAAEALSLGSHISPHSLRKTFGYYAWKNGASPVVLMSIYNHSSYEVTKRYLGIEQDDKDTIYRNLNL